MGRKGKQAMFFGAVLLVAILVGCGSDDSGEIQTDEGAVMTEEEKTGTGEKDDVRVIKLGSAITSESYLYEGMEYFKERVEELTDGSVMVGLYADSQMGTQEELIEGMRLGTVEMAYVVPVAAADFFPEISVLNTFFLAENEEHTLKIWVSDYAAGLLDEMAKEINVRCLPYFCLEGSRHFFMTFPVNTLEDLKGLKMRLPEVALGTSVIYEALGMEPVPMSISEVYTGLQTGLIDGLEYAPSGIVSNHFEDVCKYCYETNHVTSVLTFAINEELYQNELSEVECSAINQAAEEAVALMNSRYDAELEQAIAFLEESGVVFVSPTEEERARMLEIVTPAINSLLDGMITSEELDNLRALAD